MGNIQNEWTEIKGYEGLYLINQKSEIKVTETNKRAVNSALGKNGSLGLNQQTTKAGYKKVLLSKDGKRTTHLLHRLMAQTFLENKENKKTVNHKDSNRGNNNLSNLEWATHSENVKHGFLMGRVSCWKDKKGAKSHSAKRVKCVQDGKEFDTVKEAANYINVHYTDMSRYLHSGVQYIKNYTFVFI